MSLTLARVDGVQRRGRAAAGEIMCLTVGLCLILPYGMIAAIGGSAFRTLYPAYILAAAATIIARRRPLYPAFILAAFAFSPFLRRVADYQAGFAVFNLVLLAPYVGLLPTLLSLIRRPFGKPAGSPLAIIFVCIVYGALLAMFRMAFVPAIYEGLRWLLPVALCAFILECPADVPEIRRALFQTLTGLLPILTAYGIYQFIYAPPWDVFWLGNIDNPTFGEGEPYKIRVWSMMNSPGSVAVFSAFAMILLAGNSAMGLLIAAIALPLLALTVIRTAWFALVVGLGVVFWKSPPHRRLALMLGIAVIAIVGSTLISSRAMPPDIQRLVTERVQTFSDLMTDKSANDRLGVYSSFLDRLSANPWGEGFGVNESMVTRQAARAPLSSIDSGFLEAYLIYGVPVGTLYFTVLFAVLREVWISLGRLPTNYSGHGGIVCAGLAILPLGSNQIGEIGVLLWSSVAIAIAAAQPECRHLPDLRPEC